MLGVHVLKHDCLVPLPKSSSELLVHRRRLKIREIRIRRQVGPAGFGPLVVKLSEELGALGQIGVVRPESGNTRTARAGSHWRLWQLDVGQRVAQVTLRVFNRLSTLAIRVTVKPFATKRR